MLLRLKALDVCRALKSLLLLLLWCSVLTPWGALDWKRM